MTKTSDAEKTRELPGDALNHARELTEDELNPVSAGTAKGDRPVKYMEFKLKEVLISGVI